MTAVARRASVALRGAPDDVGRPVAARLTAERVVPVALCGLFVVMCALTWRKWGVPEIDAGSELTTADLVRHGAVPYQDVRYFYGPLGLYSLALAFKLFGTSFTVAYGFGLVQAAGILAAFYALARHWVRPVAAGLGTALLLAIGFSGTAFNLVLPHTNSATVGVLCLLLELLALTRRRWVLAGLAAGLVALTRPEFVLVAFAAAAAYAIGLWRDEGPRTARAAAVRLVLPAVAIPTVVLGGFALAAGASRLLTENLWPVDFIRQAGFKTQSHWMPFTLESFVALATRALIYGGLLAGLVATAVRLRTARGLGRLSAAAPLAGVAAALVALDAAARALGVFTGARAAVEEETRHLVLGMSWLPALALAAAAWAALRFIRRRPAPLSGAWAVDLALLAAASGLGLRAYAAFTAEGSYAPYYAAPLVVVAAILHERVGDRWPAARMASLGALGAAAAGLAAYALVGLYADNSVPVHTARGTIVTSPAAAPALQATLNRLSTETPAGAPILAAPADGGLYFMSGRKPALYDVMLLPGLLDSRADEQAAIRRLRALHVRTVVVAERDLAAFGPSSFGSDYNATLGAYIAGHTVRSRTVGDTHQPAGGTYPSTGFRILTLSDAPPRPD